MVLVTWVKFLGEKLKVTIPLVQPLRLTSPILDPDSGQTQPSPEGGLKKKPRYNHYSIIDWIPGRKLG